MTASEKQRTEALALANHVRKVNSLLKKDIAALPERDGRRMVADLLSSPVEGAHGQLRISQLIKSIDRTGDRALFDTLRYAGIYNSDKRLRDLTARQRNALVEVLRDKSALYPKTRLAA